MRFHSDVTCGTPAALEALHRAQVDPAHLLARHFAGDFGDLDAEDVAANIQALACDSRILSAYTLPDGVKLWIITEADRSVTTILLPEEY